MVGLKYETWPENENIFVRDPKEPMKTRKEKLNMKKKILQAGK